MPTPLRYMFVECQDPVKRKKRNPGDAKSAARSHVTKEFHRKHRLARRETFEATTTTQAPVLQGEATSGVFEDQEDDDDVVELGPNQSQHLIPSNLHAVARSTIHSILSQSRTDPFNSLPVEDMPPFRQLLLDHALTITWPATVPTKRDHSGIHPVQAAWLNCALNSPVVFHAFLYAAGLQILTMCNGRELVQSAYQERLGHYQKTISLVNKHIRELQGPPPDALIMAILCLITHGSQACPPPIECHPQSPLATQQYLHVYGQLLTEETHVPGLRELLRRKGGPEQVKTFGMSDTAILSDLYLATRHVEKPQLAIPRPWKTQSMVVVEKYTPDFATSALDSVIGSSFEYLCATPAGIKFCGVVTNVAGVILALDQHSRHTPHAPDMLDIVALRNVVQHQLLSLDVTSSDDDTEDWTIAEVCRIATLIFSDMVIFPLPAAQRVKPTLALRLRNLLEKLTMSATQEAAHRKTLVWATALGSVASTNTDGHEWFLEQLTTHLSALRLQNSHELRSLCLTFLWWPPVCDPPGEVIWNEVQQVVERLVLQTVDE